MMKVKTSELIGIALDWAVAKCEGWPIEIDRGVSTGRTLITLTRQRHEECRPSTDWAQAGPIIEHEEIGIKRRAPCFPQEQWEASGSITAKGAGYWFAVGPTPLIAAMRCYVASKLGDKVDIPEELT